MPREHMRVARCWCLLALLGGCAALAVSALPDTNPTIPFNGDLCIGAVFPLKQAPSPAPCYAIAAILAVRDINNGSIMSFPSGQSRLLPNNRVRIFFNDSLSDARKALTATLWQMENRRTMAILGEVTSGVTTNMANLVSAFETPLVAPIATVQDLSNKDEYPYFARVVGGDDQQARAMHALMIHFGWVRAQVVYATDTYGTAFAANLQAVASLASRNGDLSVQFAALHSFESGNLASISAAVQAMDEEGSPIVILLGSHSSDARLIATMMVGMGIVGKYQFVGCDGWLHAGTLRPNLPGLANFTAFLNGAVGTLPLIPSGRALDFNLRLAGEGANLSDPYLASAAASCNPSQNTASYVYDAVIAIAKAASLAAAGHTVGETLSGSQLMAQLLGGLHFDGLTGRVGLDANGDRFASYSITNYVPSDGVATVGIGVWAQDEATGQGTISFTRQPVFVGGATTPPPSTRPLGIGVRVGDVTRHGLIAGSVLFGFVFALVPLAMVLWYREHIAIKSSNVRLTCLFLLGVLIGSIHPAVNAISRRDSGASMITLCMLPYILLALSFDLIFSALVTKTHYIFQIHNNRQLHVLRMDWWRTTRFTVFLVLIDAAVFIAFGATDMPSLRAHTFASRADYNFFVCTQDFSLLWELLLIIPKFLLLVATAFVAFRARDVPFAFNESRFIALVLYNLTLVGVLMIVLTSVVSEPASSLIIASIGVWFCLSVSSALLMIPKFLVLWAALRKEAPPPSLSMSDDVTHTLGSLPATSQQDDSLRPPVGAVHGADELQMMSRFTAPGTLSAYVLRMAKEGASIIEVPQQHSSIRPPRHSQLRASHTTDEEGNSVTVPIVTTSNATSAPGSLLPNPAGAPLVFQHGSVQPAPAASASPSPSPQTLEDDPLQPHQPQPPPPALTSSSIVEVRFHAAVGEDIP